MPDSDDKSGPRADISHQSELAVARLAARQLGLAERGQLYGSGLSADQIRHRVRQGRLHPVFRHVYAVGHRAIVPRAHLLAALLSAGPAAFLSHRTAAAVHGLRPINTHDIELTLPGTGGARSQPRLAVHRTAADPHPTELRTVGLLRVSSALRLIVELAARETDAEVERLIAEAIHRRLLRPDTADGREAIEATLQRHARRPGMARARRGFAVYRRIESHRSQLERAFDRLLAQHPDIPAPERNVRRGRWELDRYWPQQRVVVELDGRPYHLTAAEMERDRIKDADLQSLGIKVIRVTDARFELDRGGVLYDLRRCLDLPAGDPPRRGL